MPPTQEYLTGKKETFEEWEERVFPPGVERKPIEFEVDSLSEEELLKHRLELGEYRKKPLYTFPATPAELDIHYLLDYIEILEKRLEQLGDLEQFIFQAVEKAKERAANE